MYLQEQIMLLEETFERTNCMKLLEHILLLKKLKLLPNKKSNKKKLLRKIKIKDITQSLINLDDFNKNDIKQLKQRIISLYKQDHHIKSIKIQSRTAAISQLVNFASRFKKANEPPPKKRRRLSNKSSNNNDQNQNENNTVNENNKAG